MAPAIKPLTTAMVMVMCFWKTDIYDHGGVAAGIATTGFRALR
jgi:hypothetical protein